LNLSILKRSASVQVSLIENRSEAYDLIRCIAAFMVVLLHCSAYFVSRKPFQADSSYLFATIIDGFCRVCVPLFILLSGALLLNRPLPLTVFYKTRFLRILPPLFFWSLLALIYTAWRMKQNGLINYPVLWNNLAGGRPFYHLWYLFMLPGLYLCAPWLLWLRQNTALKYYLLLLTSVLTYAVVHYHQTGGRPDQGQWYFWFLNYLGYFMLGGLIVSLKISYRKLWLLSYLGCTVVALWLALLPLKQFADFYYLGYQQPLIITATVALFIYLLKMRIFDGQFLKKVGSYSFGIYLTHAFILDILTLALKNSRLLSHSGWGIPLLVLTVLILSACVVKLLRITKIGRWIC